MDTSFEAPHGFQLAQEPLTQSGLQAPTAPVANHALPYLARFTVWSHPQQRVPRNEPAVIKPFFIATFLSQLQLDLPEFAGPLDPLEECVNIVRTMELGGTCVLHRIAVSVQSYAEDSPTPRFIVRFVCLDVDQPLVLEFDTPFGTAAREYDWASGTLSFQILARSQQAAFSHPIVAWLLGFLGVSIPDALDAVADAYTMEDESPSALLQQHLDDEGERQRGVVDKAMRRANAAAELKVEAAVSQAKRDGRKLERFNESLKQQLETSQAVAGRNKQRADALDKQLRAVGSTSQPTEPVLVQPEVSVADAEELISLRLLVSQQRDEIDGLRADLHRAHQRMEVTPVRAATSETNVVPTTFDGMQQWIDRNLAADRVLVYPKAMRAARKSVFRDAPLVYRTLKAINDHYWPAKMHGDAAAARQWEDFLRRERLTFGSTGAAPADHRTRESYRLTYQKQQYPLDLHVQGSNSRKEEDCFRLYFHASKQIGKVLVGHFPTHLPNTHD